MVILVSFPSKMTDNLLTRWITVILVRISNNGHFGGDYRSLSITVILVKNNDHFGTE